VCVCVGVSAHVAHTDANAYTDPNADASANADAYDNMYNLIMHITCTHTRLGSWVSSTCCAINNCASCRIMPYDSIASKHVVSCHVASHYISKSACKIM